MKQKILLLGLSVCLLACVAFAEETIIKKDDSTGEVIIKELIQVPVLEAEIDALKREIQRLNNIAAEKVRKFKEKKILPLQEDLDLKKGRLEKLNAVLLANGY